jgi:thiamine-phosphate pyrophosphorylase
MANRAKSHIGRLHAIVSSAELARAAIEGCANVIQFRNKEMTDRKFLESARQFAHLCRTSGRTFIVNDHVDVALMVGADGVHVGPNDLPVADVRRLLGSDRWIGRSVDTPEEAQEAEKEGADYVGAGPVFPTSSKRDAGPLLGVHGLARIVRAVTIPVIAIGGISAACIPDVLATGAHGVALLSAIFESDRPAQIVRHVHEIIESSKC